MKRRENRGDKQAKKKKKNTGNQAQTKTKKTETSELVPTQYPLPDARHFVHLRMPKRTLNKMAAVTCKNEPPSPHPALAVAE